MADTPADCQKRSAFQQRLEGWRDAARSLFHRFSRTCGIEQAPIENPVDRALGSPGAKESQVPSEKVAGSLHALHPKRLVDSVARRFRRSHVFTSDTIREAVKSFSPGTAAGTLDSGSSKRPEEPQALSPATAETPTDCQKRITFQQRLEAWRDAAHRGTPLERCGDVHPNPGPSLRVLQYNAAGLGPPNKQLMVSEALGHHEIDIGSFQELKIGANQRIHLAFFDNDMELRSTMGGGVMNSVRHTSQLHKRRIIHPIPEVYRNDIEAITTKITTAENEILCVTTLYIPEGEIPLSVLDSIRAAVGDLPHLLIGDVNVHAASWDSHLEPDRAGEKLEHWLDEHGYAVANDPKVYTRSQNTAKGFVKSSPDITSSCDCLITDWSAHDTLTDHRMITFTVTFGEFPMPEDNPAGAPMTTQVKWGAVPWVEFTATVEAHIENGRPENTLALERQLHDAITAARKKHCSKAGIRNKIARPGWSETISLAMDAALAAKRAHDDYTIGGLVWHCVHSPEHVGDRAKLYMKYADLRRNVRTLIDSETREAFRVQCARLKSTERDGWRFVSRGKHPRAAFETLVTTDADGKTKEHATSRARARLLVNYFARIQRKAPNAPKNTNPRAHRRRFILNPSEQRCAQGPILKGPVASPVAIAAKKVTFAERLRITSRRKTILREPEDPSEAPFVEAELHAAIHTAAANKACGRDDVFNEHIKHLGPSARTLLLKCCNASFRSGIIPRRWKEEIVCALVKPGKDPKSLDSLRPIALTSAVAKICERLIANRLKHMLDHNLTDNQSGFRPGRSTVDQLAYLSDIVSEGFNHRSKRAEVSYNETSMRTTAVLVDFSKAFNMVDHAILERRLIKLGVPGTFVRWIINFLSGRTMRVRQGQHVSCARVTTRGVPQGTVLGPVLFDYYVHSLSETLSTIPGLQHGFYADDLTLISQGWNAAETAPTLQKGLNAIKAWCTDNFMDVNADKTEYMVFSRSSRSVPDKEDLGLKFGDHPVKASELTAPRLLGVRFDHFLSFGKNVDHIKETIAIRTRQLAAVSGSEWGPTSHDLRTFFLGLVQSVITYGAEVWWHNLAKFHKDTIDIMQRRGARIISGCAASTATDDVLLEAHLQPIGDIVSVRGVKMIERYIRLGGQRGHIAQHPITKPAAREFFHFRSQFDNIVGEVCLQYGIPIDHNRVPVLTRSRYAPWATAPATRVYVRPTLIREVKKSDYDNHPDPEGALLLAKRTATNDTLAKVRKDIIVRHGIFGRQYELWTDGSVRGPRSPSGARYPEDAPYLPGKFRSGGAAILYQGTNGDRIATVHEAAGTMACSYRSECVAMRAGLKLGFVDHLRDASLLICTDSQSLLAALANGPILQTGDIENEIWDQLLQLASRNVHVTLQFVYGHCGIVRNDEVDVEADEAAELPQGDVPVWLTDFMAATKRHVKAKTESRLSASTSYRATVTKLGTEPTPLDAMNGDRKQSALLAQLRCNECPHLGRLAHRLGTSMVEACRFCCQAEHSAAAPPAMVRATANNAKSPCTCPFCGDKYATRDALKQHCMRHHDGNPDEHGILITEVEINRRIGLTPRRPKPAAKVPPKVAPKAVPKHAVPLPSAQWPSHPLDADANRVDVMPPTGPAPVLLVPNLSDDEEDENYPVDHMALLAAWRQQQIPVEAQVAVAPPPAPQLLDCPKQTCPRRALNGFKSKSGVTRHVNVYHPELADGLAPVYNDGNFAAKRGIGPVETPHHVLAECTAAVICELRLKYFPNDLDTSLSLPRTAHFFQEAIELLQPKTSVADTR